MPVRQLIKGFRCPRCTVDRIKADSVEGGTWGRTMSQYAHCVQDWAADLNWPVPIDHAPVVRQRFYDMRCARCGTLRINFGDLLALGRSDSPPQGCPRCRRSSVSDIEHALITVLNRFAAPGTNVVGSKIVAGKEVDGLISTVGQPDIALEYDGFYWHRDKQEADTRLTAVLTSTGAIVVRARPHPLLPVIGADNIELSTASDPATTAVEVLDALQARFPGRFATASREQVRSVATEAAHAHATNQR